jgi:hypothetical protein
MVSIPGSKRMNESPTRRLDRAGPKRQARPSCYIRQFMTNVELAHRPTTQSVGVLGKQEVITNTAWPCAVVHFYANPVCDLVLLLEW